MSTITTKFSIGDVCYTFDPGIGVIYRHVVKSVFTTTKNSDVEVSYDLKSMPSNTRLTESLHAEQDLYTELEVKDVANVWLLDKSVSIFSTVGL